MIENPGIGKIQDLLTIATASNKDISLKVGSVVKAHVVNVDDNGEAVLRIVSSGSDKGNSPGALIKAHSEVPLTKGQDIFLEILGGKNNLTMRFIGNSQNTAEALKQNIPVKFFNMLAQLSDSRLGNAEFNQLLNMLKALPQSVKTAIPEFQNLQKLLLDIKQIDGKLLKAFVETSGVAFETRLKIAVLNNPGSMLQGLMALQTEGDLKALLMRLKTLLKDRNMINALKQADFNIADLTKAVDKFINNIEFFQLTSKINDMFYTFLPVLWDDLRDSEFLFKKNREGNKESHTCDINLDLESIGRLSISVTISDKSFYVSFFTERHEIRDLLKSQRHLLEGRFASNGLLLKAINFNYKKSIAFGKAPEQGIKVTI